MASQMKSTKHLKNLVSILLKLFKKKNSKREYSQIHFMRLALPWYQSQIRILQEKKAEANIPDEFRYTNI